MAESRYEVIGSAPDEAPPSRASGWLSRHRFVLLLVAILAAVLVREGLADPPVGPVQQSGVLGAVVIGVAWDPTIDRSRQVEIELTSTGAGPIAAARLRLVGNGLGRNPETELNRELVAGVPTTVRFGLAQTFCAPRPAGQLVGVIFDAAGAETTVQIAVGDPGRVLTQVNELACLSGHGVTGEADARSARLTTEPSTVLRLPITVRNPGMLPFLVTEVVSRTEGRFTQELLTVVPAGAAVSIEAEIVADCGSNEAFSKLTVAGEDFSGRLNDVGIEINDRLRGLLDDLYATCQRTGT